MRTVITFSIVLALVQIGCFECHSAIGKQDKQAPAADQQKPAKTHDANVIVTSDWLAENLDDPSLRVLDLALRATNYKTGHIPGAVFVDWRKDIIDENNKELYRLPSKPAMEMLLSRLGIKNDTLIVLTDNSKNRMSVRMYFTLKYFGHDKVRVLDGGTTAWEKSGKKLTDKVPIIQPTKYTVENIRENFVASIKAVRQALDFKPVRLIDGRPSEQYTGEKPGKVFHTNKEHKRRGHVPGSESIPWAANMNDDSTFKSLDELRKLYQDHGIDTDSRVITYCNEGLHAAMPWFVLTQLLGNSTTIVYDNSMSEWANRDDTPMKEGADK